jgi:hypothetical protein
MVVVVVMMKNANRNLGKICDVTTSVIHSLTHQGLRQQNSNDECRMILNQNPSHQLISHTSSLTLQPAGNRSDNGVNIT